MTDKVWYDNLGEVVSEVFKLRKNGFPNARFVIGPKAERNYEQASYPPVYNYWCIEREPKEEGVR